MGHIFIGMAVGFTCLMARRIIGIESTKNTIILTTSIILAFIIGKISMM